MRRGLWLIPLLMFSFLATIPFPVHALCPSSCTNNVTGSNSHHSFGTSDSFTVTSLNVNDFLVAVTTCESGNSVTTVSGTGDNGWTQDASDSQGVTGTSNPVVTSVWHSKATATSDVVTFTYNVSAANGCGEYVAGFDTQATIFAGSLSAGNNVYVCTGGSSANNPCASNPQSYTNQLSAVGTSVLIISGIGTNSSGLSFFGGFTNTAPNGFTANGVSSTLFSHYPSCTALYDNVGQTCSIGQFVWAWQSSLTNYVGGINLNLGVVGDATSGNNCARGNGGKCFVQVQDFTVVYSNQAQSGQVSITACGFSQLQCWWYPLFFMGLYSGFILMVGTWLKTSPRGKSHLFLSAVTFGSLIAVIFGIMNIAFPLMMLVLNTIIALRLRA